MRLCVSTYSFQSLIGRGVLSQFDCIQKAKELGFDAIEFSGLQPQDDSSPLEYAGALYAQCEKVGLPVSNYAVSADFLTGSEGDLEAEIERVKGEIEIAHALGAVSLRHDASWGYPPQSRQRGFDAALPRLAEGCRRVTQYAKERGIRTMVENHGFFCQDSVRMERLVNAVADENFGLLCDIGNFLCVDEDPVQALSRVAPYAFFVHAKDFLVKSGCGPHPGAGFLVTRGGNFLRGTIIGHGAVPVFQCLRILKNAGYQGDLSVEFEGMEEPLTAISLGLQNLRRWLKEMEAE